MASLQIRTISYYVRELLKELGYARIQTHQYFSHCGVTVITLCYVQSSLKLLSTTSGERTGIMIPIPQYPLYSASIVEYNMDQVGYYLDEDHQWGLDVAELERSIKEARKHCNVRAIVIINPGNPTGKPVVDGQFSRV